MFYQVMPKYCMLSGLVFLRHKLSSHYCCYEKYAAGSKANLKTF